MNNFTTNTYQMKREIVKFSNKLCNNSNQLESKFVTGMIYGISKSKDILLSSIVFSKVHSSTSKDYISTNSRGRKGLLCKCFEGTNNSKKEMDKFSIGIWSWRNANDVS